MEYDFGIIGGDMRQVYMIDLLTQLNYKVIVYSIDSNKDYIYANSLSQIMESSKVIIAPIPFSKDGKNIFALKSKPDLTVENFILNLNKDSKVFGGNIDKNIIKCCNIFGVECYDLMKDNKISILNAIATAEGTIMEAIKNSKINLHNSKCIILGFGKCAKILANKLNALNSNVYICARNYEDLTLAQAYGYKIIPLKDLKTNINQFDFIFNTIPIIILTEDILSNVSKNATIIDIASSPGGLDYSATKKLNLNAKLCLGIPGKVSPKTSANILVNNILSLLKLKE